jgi:hypothetical protein
MTNDQYLIVSYFAVISMTISLGVIAYVWLRRPFNVLMEAIRGANASQLWKKLFPFGLVLPALLGFVSVSYRSCDVDSYEKIVRERSYLVAKNQEQLMASLSYILIAIVCWNVVVLLLLKYRQKDTQA